MEVFPAPLAIQVVHPPERVAGHSDKVKFTWVGRRRRLLPDRMLLNSYLLPHDLAPPMEEVSVSELESAQEIIDRWRSFNRGESLAEHLHEMYPIMLRMPVAVQAGGRAKSSLSRS